MLVWKQRHVQINQTNSSVVRYLFSTSIVLIFLYGLPRCCLGQTISVGTTSNKEFLVLDRKMIYSDYESACPNEGLDIGEIGTNAEYLLVQGQVWSKLSQSDNAVWLSLRTEGSGWAWATEDIDPVLWWKGEPNGLGLQPTGGYSARCEGVGGDCRPVQMSSDYPTGAPVKPLLRDTCCMIKERVLCMRDVDECLNTANHQCPENSRCVNQDYSYKCECLAGYVKTADKCSDINECGDPSAYSCHANSECQNTIGSYTCSCLQGYSDNGGVCTDVNECGAITDPCPAHSTCKNTAGSYICQCAAGYQMDSQKVCQDINECDWTTTNPCPAHSACSNTDGSFECQCLSGFQKSSTGDCQDIDECAAASTSSCPVHSTCGNTEGSYTCQCLAGYQMDAKDVCQDINECKIPGAHSCPAQSTCSNTDGSYDCLCLNGFQMDTQKHCQDINECESTIANPCPTLSTCENTEGGYLCQCVAGYQKDSLGTCQDVDECEASGVCPDHSACNNTDGSYHCQCSDGFQQDSQGNCTDIDECLDILRSPCSENTRCRNTEGNFTCEELGQNETKSSKVCPCVCYQDQHSHTVRKLQEQIRQDMYVNARRLSAKIRRLTSADDNCSFCLPTGTFAVAILISVAALMLISDLWRCCSGRSNPSSSAAEEAGSTTEPGNKNCRIVISPVPDCDSGGFDSLKPRRDSETVV